MSQDRPHSRSGPGATTGAWAGASGLDPNVPLAGDVIQPGGPAVDDAAGLPGDPLPLQPGKEYVDKVDHERVVETLTAERDDMRDSLQRMAADYENFKRRSALQRQQASAAAETQLLGELLVVIDDMERAAAHADQVVESHPKVAEGVRMVQGRLEGLVTGHGLERIEAVGTFDPSLHEAMMVQPTEGVEEGQIVQVLQSGWRLGDRVLRHARVIVAG
jgi:molecular chaperone GrpE